MALDRTRTLRGALAGAAAAGVWAAQQPLDKRVFGVDYDDAELLGTLRHARRGAGVPARARRCTSPTARCSAPLYANVAPRAARCPPALRGPLAGLAEHLATWPATPLLARLHPAAGDLPQLWGNRARVRAGDVAPRCSSAPCSASVERRLNPPEPSAGARSTAPRAPSNGHGSAEHLVAARRPAAERASSSPARRVRRRATSSRACAAAGDDVVDRSRRARRASTCSTPAARARAVATRPPGRRLPPRRAGPRRRSRGRTRGGRCATTSR